MDRRTARELAFKLLFQLGINDENINQNKNKNPFTSLLVTGVMENKQKIDDIISDNIENWTIDRIGNVEKTILRIATYEINFLDDIPNNVSINEAVELAHKYGDDKSSKFINGVLAKIII